MSKTERVWVRRMAVVTFVLALAGIGFYAPSVACATESDETDVVEEAAEGDTSLAVQSAVALDEEEEIALMQQADPNAEAFVSSGGSLTSCTTIGEALSAWSAATGDARLTLRQDVTATINSPVSFSSSGKKTLNLNGHTATITASYDENVPSNKRNALIYAGEDTEDVSPSSNINVDLVIEDSSGAGALVGNNVENVIAVCGYNRGGSNDYSSSLELSGGTISGGTVNTIKVFGNGSSGTSEYSARFKMISGTIRGCTGSSGDAWVGYGVRIYGKALFEMHGGTICSNISGGVYLKCRLENNSGGTTSPVLPRFILRDGTICDNGAEGVRLAEESDFAMYGGTIRDNKGAGVSVSTTQGYSDQYATFTMSGGEITGNATGVFVKNNEGDIFNLQGSPKILGNGSDGVACNVKLEGMLIDSSEFSKRIQITGPLARPDGADGPQIGVTIPADGTDVFLLQATIRITSKSTPPPSSSTTARRQKT